MKSPIIAENFEILKNNLFSFKKNWEYTINIFELAKRTTYFTMSQIKGIITYVENNEIRLYIINKIFPNILDRSKYEEFKKVFNNEEQYQSLINLINFNYDEKEIYENDENYELYKKWEKEIEKDDLFFIRKLSEIKNSDFFAVYNSESTEGIADNAFTKLKIEVKRKVTPKRLRDLLGERITISVKKAQELLKELEIDDNYDDLFMQYILRIYPCLNDPQNIEVLVDEIKSEEIRNDCRMNMLNLPNRYFNIKGHEYTGACCDVSENCLIF